jgi:hypothetical protein
MTLGAFIYFALLALWSAFVAYLLLFKIIPYIVTTRKIAHEVRQEPVTHSDVHPMLRRTYSTREGFSSLKKGEHLTIEDIVTAFTHTDHK